MLFFYFSVNFNTDNDCQSTGTVFLDCYGGVEEYLGVKLDL